MNQPTSLHEHLDMAYGPTGAEVLRGMLKDGADVDGIDSKSGEAPIHTATRRRRLDAVEILLDAGADKDALNGHGKSAYVHAARRGFDEVAEFLSERGADTSMNDAGRLAVALSNHQLDEARQWLADHPGIARTGNPEEDRLLADMAGRPSAEPVKLLISAGANLAAPGLDGGTPLHNAAWFAQPKNARLLVEAGAPLDVFERVHGSSPIGWVAHGSRYSGGAEQQQDAYVELASLLLAAGCQLHYPGDEGGAAYRTWLLEVSTPRVAAVLKAGA